MVRKALGLPIHDTSSVQIRIYMRVPGGADWSNTDLEVDERENGERLIVETKENTYEETEE